jgi:lipopolysaccharide biosynthesis glycosyltransferase
MIKVYVGYDPREDIAYQVCRYSILKHCPSAEVIPLTRPSVYTRPDDGKSSTSFTFTRFLVPHLNNYQGWALYVDCDFLFTDDVSKLFALADDQYSVMVVKHDYTPKSTVKMDGQTQYLYPRKNWSSLVLWNCSKNKLDPDVVNTASGQYLHRFQWLDDQQIGSIDKEWNWLVGWYKEGSPRALHYTEGGPWFENYKFCEHHEIWKQYLKELDNK